MRNPALVRSRACAGTLAALLLAAAARAAQPALTADMVSDEPAIVAQPVKHTVRTGAGTLAYTAEFREFELADDAGAVQATISATAYLRAGVKDSAARPVLFAFNGGPGASSSPLHFGALGPRRWTQGEKGNREIVANEYTLLDVADLVFVDPVGTGFSRLRPNGDAARYWSRAGDAAAVVTLIRTWLREHRREASPLFIAGESYGGFRLATAAPQLADFNLAGLVFVSPLLDASAAEGAPGNELPYVFELPTLAAAAWYHERVPRAGRTVEQHFEAAAQFAQTEFAAALLQGNALPAAERARIAARMSEFTGLPAATIAAAHLRLDSEVFLNTLLADRNLLLGRLDTRVTAPKPEPRKDSTRPPGADDPALGMKGSNVIKSAAIRDYLQRELGVRTARDYLSLSLDVNFRWDWRGPAWPPEFYVNPTANVAALLRQKPAVRVWLAGGLFDLATPLLAPRYAFAHADIDAARVTVAAFVAGHSPFEGAENLPRFTASLREFVRAQGTPSH